jgi:hypothetical protein
MACGCFGVPHKSVQYVIARHFLYVFSNNQGCTNPGGQNFVLWLVVFLGREYGTCFMLGFWLETFPLASRYLGGLWIVIVIHVGPYGCCVH